MNWWKRLAKNRLLDVGVAVIGILSLVRIVAMLPSRVWGFDFNHYYVSSRLLLQGKNPYTTPLEPMSREMGFEFNKALHIGGYPPSFLWLFAPLASLPPRVAFAIWVAGEVASFGLLLWFTRHLLRDRLSPRGWMFVCAAAIAAQPVFWHFCYSQVQLLLAFVVLGAYVWHKRGQHTAACLAVTAAGMLKFYPFVLLPWFVWRSHGSARGRVNGAILSLALGTVIVLLTGPARWADFLRLGMPMAVKNEIGLNFHYAVPSLITNLGLAASGFNPSEMASRLWWTAGSAAGLLVIALAYLVCFRNRGDEETEFCLLCVAMLAGTVTVQGHYFVWLIFPMAVAALYVARKPSGKLVLLLSLVGLLLNEATPPPTSLLRDHIYLKILINYLPLLGLVALGTFLGNELAKTRPRGATES